MTNRSLILIAGLLICVTALFAAGAMAPEQQGERPKATPKQPAPLDVFSVVKQGSAGSKAKGSEVAAFDSVDCICPVYPYEYYEGYWMYYAIRCSDCSPTSLMDEPGLPYTPCPGCFENPPGDCPGFCLTVFGSDVSSPDSKLVKWAIDLGNGYSIANSRKPGRPNVAKAGFSQKRSRSYEIQLNEKIAARQADFIVKVVRKSGEPFLAKLVLVTIDPQRIPGLPKRFSHLTAETKGLGFEIAEPSSTTVDYGNVVTEHNGDVVPVAEHSHCYMVRYKHVWYRVLCHAGHVR